MESASEAVFAESVGAGITRSVLAGLPRVQVAGLPRGMVAVLRRRVLATGLDLQDVRRWLWTTSGYESETYLRVAREAGGPLNPEPYFAIPLSALLPAD
jgi:hypothetical protein